MTEVLRDYWKYLLGALLLHGGFVALLMVTIAATKRDMPLPQLAIQATIVDASTLRSVRSRRPEPQPVPRVEPEPQQPDPAEEQRRQEEEAAKRAAEQVEQQRRAEEVRQIEATRQADLKRQQEAEVKRQQEEADRQRRADTERKKAEEDKKRIADIERRQKEEAEKQRKAAEARAQAAREDELKRQLAEEEGVMAAQSSVAGNQYIARIQQHIERNWNKPPSARAGLECEVKVSQAPGGTVLTVQLGRCNGDAAVRQSIEAAVYRASPLPAPPDPRLFERNLILVFRPAE